LVFSFGTIITNITLAQTLESFLTTQFRAVRASQSLGALAALMVSVIPIVRADVAGASNWTAQSSGVGNVINDVHFVDSNTGWFVGYNDMVRKTTDGGATWTAQNPGAGESLYGVSFVDANTGWVSGTYGALRKTVNGGTSWTTQTPATGAHCWAVFGLNANTAWQVGSSGMTGRTTNGGVNWVGGEGNPSGNPGYGLYDVQFLDANNGYCTAGRSWSAKTTDGGVTWTRMSTVSSAQLYHLSFVDVNTGWAVGNSGTIIKTTDAGTTWTVQTSGTTVNLSGVSFVDANTGWVVGNSGTILHTTDGGSTWTAEPSGTTATLTDVHFLDANTGWAVGDAGTLLKYSGAASAPVTVINDEFDDGDLATNTTGTGSGFISRGQAGVTESGGFLNLNTSSDYSYSTMVAQSNTAVNPFQATNTTATFKFGNIGYASSWQRFWVGYRLASATGNHFYPDSGVQGLYVSIISNTGSENNYTYKGNLVAHNGSTRTILASWNWSSLSAGSLNNLKVSLTTSATTYSLDFADAAATPVYTYGSASGTLSGMGALGADFAPGIHNQHNNTSAVGGVVLDSVLVQTNTGELPPPPSENLASLTLSAGTLNPVFSSSTLAYTASVPNAISSITVTPTAANAGATITVNGTAVSSGGTSGGIALAVGLNTITTVVTAPGGSPTKTYTVGVTRNPPRNIWTGNPLTFTKAAYANTNLEANQDRLTDNVWLTRGSNQGLFNIAQQGSYSNPGPLDTEWAYGTTADIDSLTFQSWLDWHGRNPPSAVGRDAVLHLIEDDIYIDIKILSWQEGTGGAFSYIRSTGVPGPSHTLTNLSLSTGALSPGFAPKTYAYSTTVPPGTSSVTVTPVAEEVGATITVNGSAVTSGSPSGSIALVSGLNIITAVVTAPGGGFVRTYTLRVTRGTAGAGIVMDFEGLLHSDGGTDPTPKVGPRYEEDGFVLEDLTNYGFGSWGTAASGYTGSPGLFNNQNFGTTRLTKAGGGTFTLNSMFLGGLSSSGPLSQTFTGTRIDNSTVTQTHVSSGNATVTFTGFTDLVKVEWVQGAGSPYHQFDQIVLNIGQEFPDVPVPEIAVSGNSTDIPDGDSTPGKADHTDFGSVLASSGTVVRTFTIQNVGTAELTLGNASLGGTNAADFSITAQPAPTVPAGDSTTLQVTFDPGAVGVRAAVVSFTNNDGDENPFNFSIQGTGSLLALTPGEWAGNFNVLGATWDGTHLMKHIGGHVNAIADTADWVIYGGVFNTFGNSKVSNLAAISKTTGQVTDLGGGVNGEVHAVAVVGSELYVCGSFNLAGGVAASGIARWDGTAWSSVGGAAINANALVVIGTDLYVGGSFSSVGGIAASNIAKWDGAAWTALGAGISGPNGTYPRVYALAAANGQLYAAGHFETADGVAAQNIAKWNGSTWTALGTGLATEEVTSLAADGTKVYAGGWDLLKVWDGNVWTEIQLNSGLGFGVKALTVHQTSLYIGLEPDLLYNSPIIKWDTLNQEEDYEFIPNIMGPLFGFGHDHSETPYVSAIYATGDEIHVGGFFAKIFGDDFGEQPEVSAINVAKWDGSQWGAVVAGDGLASSGGLNPFGSGIASSVLEAGPVVYVAGEFDFAGGARNHPGTTEDGLLTSVAIWNKAARTWTRIPNTGLENSSWSSGENAVLAQVGTDIYLAVGSYVFRLDTNGSSDVEYAEYWYWAEIGTLNGNVKAMAQKDGSLYVGGEFTDINGTIANNIARWNGTAWSPVGTGANSVIHAMTVNGADLYVGGEFDTIDGVSASRVAKWNGTAWSAVGGGVSDGGSGGSVSALASSGSEVIAGGYFTLAGGQPASNIARWNGTSWTALGSGVNGDVSGLAVSDGNAYVVGDFTNAGGSLASGVAQWNGSAWAPMNTGAVSYQAIKAVATDGDSVYCGGSFTQMGGKLSNGFAEFALPVSLLAPPTVTSINPNSGPIGGGTSVTLTGTNFTGATGVTIGGAAATSVSVINSTTLTCVTPPGAAGARSVLVTTQGGTNAANTLFTYVVPAPTVGAVSPASGTMLGGTSVTISGTNLAGATSVTIGGVAATNVTVVDATTITATTPAHAAGVVSVLVTTPGGTNEANTLFTYTGPEVNVTGNNVLIADGDSTPATEDHTDFGTSALTGGTVVRTFTIENTGDATLDLNGSPVVALSGDHAADFTITLQPASTVAAGGSTTFQVTFDPSAVGVRTAAVSFTNNDADENPFNFSIQGTGILPGVLALGSELILVNEEAGTVSIPVVRTGGSDGVVSAKLSTATGTATAPADYTTVTDQTVEFADGDSAMKMVSISIKPDTLTEINEVFTVALSSPSGGATMGSLTTSRVRIVDLIDTTKPTVVITTPKPAAKVATGSGLVTGTAMDNRGIVRVEVSLNAGPFVEADVVLNDSGTSATFSINVTTVLGANTLKARSIDTRGNVSTDYVRSYTGVLASPLALTLSPAAGGTVSVSPALVGGMALHGVTYTLQSFTNTGYIWNGWTAAGVSGAAAKATKLTVVMSPGLTITANFLANPYKTGAYVGLATAAAGVTPSQANFGRFSGTLTPAGSFSGSVNFAGTTSSFVAAFDKTTGNAAGSNASLSWALHLDLTGVTDKITGTLTRTAGGMVCNVEAGHAHFSAANPVPEQFRVGTGNGIYTAVFPARLSQAGLTTAGYPQGDGYATITVIPAGTVSLSGVMADGTTVTASAPMTKAHTWPLAIIIAGTATAPGMSFGGQVQFDTTMADSDLAASDLQWFRPAKAGMSYYPAGWPAGILSDIVGCKFVKPVGSAVLPGLGAVNSATGNATLELSDGLLTSMISKNVNISTTNVITKAPTTDASYTPTLTFTTGVPLLGGSFTHTGSSTIKPLIKGIIMTKGASAGGYGFFLSPVPAGSPTPGQGGGVSLTAK
jgi:photosystem II stability/assembly factor-like uncharacterized protein